MSNVTKEEFLRLEGDFENIRVVVGQLQNLVKNFQPIANKAAEAAKHLDYIKELGDKIEKNHLKSDANDFFTVEDFIHIKNGLNVALTRLNEMDFKLKTFVEKDDTEQDILSLKNRVNNLECMHRSNTQKIECTQKQMDNHVALYHNSNGEDYSAALESLSDKELNECVAETLSAVLSSYEGDDMPSENKLKALYAEFTSRI